MKLRTRPGIGHDSLDSSRRVFACGARSPRAWPCQTPDGHQVTVPHAVGFKRGNMDLRLNDRTAIVCAASQGLGKASAMALAREGVHLVIAARRREGLESAADEIASTTGNRPKTVVADVTTKDGRDAILATCPAPDILINNAGGPPPGDFRKFEREDWIKALDGNMLAPIALIKATLDGMIVRKFGRIVNVTSHAVKSPVAMLALSNGARSGLTGFVAGLARSTAEHNV